VPDLSNQRRLAAALLKCGEGRVWLDPSRTEDLADAVTRQDVRAAIKAGVIRALPVVGTSRVRARIHQTELDRGRHRGDGSRKGSPYARVPKKSRWMLRIRAQRELLAELRDTKKIPASEYRRFYRRAKGGMFRSRSHLMLNLKLAGAIKEGTA
jgi:large subunit ribosomal protein L19e